MVDMETEHEPSEPGDTVEQEETEHGGEDAQEAEEFGQAHQWVRPCWAGKGAHLLEEMLQDFNPPSCRYSWHDSAQGLARMQSVFL